jgi:hypothetical protein
MQMIVYAIIIKQVLMLALACAGYGSEICL